jgi:hypothetical protein
MKTASNQQGVGRYYQYMSAEHRRIMCDIVSKAPVSTLHTGLVRKMKKHLPRGMRK